MYTQYSEIYNINIYTYIDVYIFANVYMVNIQICMIYINIYIYEYRYKHICGEYIRADCIAVHTYGTAYVPTVRYLAYVEVLQHQRRQKSVCLQTLQATSRASMGHQQGIYRPNRALFNIFLFIGIHFKVIYVVFKVESSIRFAK